MGTLIKMQFDPDVAKDVGTDSAIILSNIEYWTAKNKANGRNLHDGNYWTYNSISAFKEQFNYLTESQIRRCLKKLEDYGYIEVGNYNKSNYDRTKWYCSIRKVHLTFLTNGTNENVKPIPDNKPYLKPDNKQEGFTSPDLNFFNKVKDYYNYKRGKMPECIKLTDKRKKAIKARLKEYSETDIFKVIDLAQKSEFLQGKSDRGWIADIDFIFQESKFIKILEGGYKNNDKPKKKSFLTNRPEAKLNINRPDK